MLKCLEVWEVEFLLKYWRVQMTDLQNLIKLYLKKKKPPMSWRVYPQAYLLGERSINSIFPGWSWVYTKTLDFSMLWTLCRTSVKSAVEVINWKANGKILRICFKPLLQHSPECICQSSRINRVIKCSTQAGRKKSTLSFAHLNQICEFQHTDWPCLKTYNTFFWISLKIISFYMGLKISLNQWNSLLHVSGNLRWITINNLLLLLFEVVPWKYFYSICS